MNSVVITRDDIIAYAEVDYIIHHMDEKYIEKVPQKLLTFFDEIKDPNYEVKINPFVPLQTQGLKKYTLEIIALLHIKYWCENEERRKELYDLMLKNQEKLEEQVKEKMSIDNLFDNNSAQIVKEESDLEKESYSRPRTIQYYDQYQQNNDIQDYTDVVVENSNTNSLEKVEEINKVENIFSKILKKISNFFNKKEKV